MLIDRTTVAIVLSIGSFHVASGAFTVSVFNAWRDSPRLRVTSEFYEGSSPRSRRVRVVVMNRGRRPVILRGYGGSRGEDWSITFLEPEKGGLRLGENERREFSLEADDAFLLDPDSPEAPYERAWVEDSLGNRHPIPQWREHVSRLIGA